MTDFRYRGEDAYPLIDEWIRTKAEAYWARTTGRSTTTRCHGPPSTNTSCSV